MADAPGEQGTGRHPDCDAFGTPFSSTHFPKLAELAGRELAGGFRGAWSGMRGDAKYIQQVFKFDNFYGRNSICHLCRACKTGEEQLLFTDFSSTAGHRSTQGPCTYKLACLHASAGIQYTNAAGA